MNTLSALALAASALFSPVSATVDSAPALPACATMGSNFQCDEERALSQSVVPIWEENFNLTYVTTRTDGVAPSVTDKMLVIQDSEFPNMYHVFNRKFAQMLHV